jgi:hypothetical protein
MNLGPMRQGDQSHAPEKNLKKKKKKKKKEKKPRRIS